MLRFLAVSIALAAFVDPAITTARRGTPIVAVVPVDAHADSALASRVRAVLDDDFLVVPSHFPGADATVLAGSSLPTNLDAMSVPTFAVSDAAARTVHLTSVRAPVSASLHAPVHIEVTAQPRGNAALPVSFALQHEGVIVDRIVDSVTARRPRVTAALTFVPSVWGAARLRVLTSAGEGGDTAVADVLVDIHDRPLSILVFDARPSYQSTFVRRALERDTRLTVTSRTVTSRNISTVVGDAPSRLDDTGELARFDAIVVGAPDALTDRDISGLERFLRERGGSVVLLLDTRTRGPYERLTGVREWRYRDVDRGTQIIAERGDTARLRASQQYAPAQLPEGATPLARAHLAETDSGASAAGDPVLWATSVGVGRLVVSGALDAWRYRERDVSSFDRVWQRVVLEAAALAVPPISVTLAHSLLAPREHTVVSVSVRSALLRAPADSTSTRVSAHLETGDSASVVRSPVRLWPAGDAGELEGTVVAPAESGVARLVITADGHRTETPLLVDGARRRSSPDGGAVLAAWAAAHGGQVIPASDLASFPRTLDASLQSAERAVRWHPMRSPWWLLPFAFALSAEWWLRRRTGLA